MYTITEPANKNFLSPLGFKFAIKKTPNVNYFVQSVSMPGVSLGSANLPTPFVRVPIAGDHLGYGDLQITFKIDENMTNYLEIFNWLKQIGFPDTFDQYDPTNVYSDATLTVLSSAMNPKFEVQFYDMYPTDIGGINFNTISADVDYIETIATFRFRSFDIIPL